VREKEYLGGKSRLEKFNLQFMAKGTKYNVQSWSSEDKQFRHYDNCSAQTPTDKYQNTSGISDGQKIKN